MIFLFRCHRWKVSDFELFIVGVLELRDEMEFIEEPFLLDSAMVEQIGCDVDGVRVPLCAFI